MSDTINLDGNDHLAKKRSLKRIQRVLTDFREASPFMPLKTAEILTHVALHPGITMKQLTEDLDISQAGCSDSISRLSEWKNPDEPGLGFIVSAEDPHERRKKVLHLTPKGEEFIIFMSDLMG